MKKQFALVVAILSTLSLMASPLTLSDLEDSMMKSNTNIRKADETVNQAYLDVKDAKANYQPTITLSGTGTYMVNPPIGQITMESSDILSQMGLGNYANMASGYVTLYDGMENTLYMGTLSLTQPLITWGKLKKAVDLYSTAYSAQTFKRDDTVRQAQAELRVRVWSLRYLDELYVLLDEAQGYADELVTIAESGYQNGMLLKQEYLNAKISAMEVQVKLAELDMQYKEVLNGLKTLVAMNELDPKNIELGEEDWLRYSSADINELSAKATSSSSDNIKAAKSLISVYNLQNEIAQRSMYGIPDFGLQVSLSYGGSRFPFAESGFRQKDSYGLNISVGFTSTVWDGGKLLNNMNRAKSNIRDAQATYDNAVEQLRDAVNSNYNSMKYLVADLEYKSLKIENLENDLTTVRTSVEYGQKSRADEVKKLLEVVTAKSEMVAERIQLVQNVFTLDYLTGVEF